MKDRTGAGYETVAKFIDATMKERKVSDNGITRIGFHGWSREVSRKDIHVVRNAAELDIAHGYDSQSFFAGVETPLSLIKKYEEPLRRLAFR
jgi:hypothetical protein